MFLNMHIQPLMTHLLLHVLHSEFCIPHGLVLSKMWENEELQHLPNWYFNGGELHASFEVAEVFENISTDQKTTIYKPIPRVRYAL